jgi:hypothetical protein
MPSGCFAVGVEITPNTTPARFWPGSRFTATACASTSSDSWKRPAPVGRKTPVAPRSGGAVNKRTISYG